MIRNMKTANIYWMLALVAVLLSGCGGHQVRTKSSIVDYLYPNDSGTIIQPSTPILNIPIKVGISFVPEQFSSSSKESWMGTVEGGYLTETRKSSLLEKIADNFRKYEFVKEIEVIPSEYLTKRGGFKNLDQIKTRYGIEVIALVSYEQVQFIDEDKLSLTYWTLVGAYVVSGEQNDTSTMLDTAVYDIQSRKMLFRAPGASDIKGSSTPVNLSAELRTDSITGFEKAVDEMIINLDAQLHKFREKIKSNPEKIKIIHRKGT